MADSTIALLTWVAIATGVAASFGSLFLAIRHPEQRKAHAARALLFGVIAVTMVTLR